MIFSLGFSVLGKMWRFPRPWALTFEITQLLKILSHLRSDRQRLLHLEVGFAVIPGDKSTSQMPAQPGLSLLLQRVGANTEPGSCLSGLQRKPPAVLPGHKRCKTSLCCCLKWLFPQTRGLRSSWPEDRGQRTPFLTPALQSSSLVPCTSSRESPKLLRCSAL